MRRTATTRAARLGPFGFLDNGRDFAVLGPSVGERVGAAPAAGNESGETALGMQPVKRCSKRKSPLPKGFQIQVRSWLRKGRSR